MTVVVFFNFGNVWWPTLDTTPGTQIYNYATDSSIYLPQTQYLSSMTLKDTTEVIIDVYYRRDRLHCVKTYTTNYFDNCIIIYNNSLLNFHLYLGFQNQKKRFT
jgi:hypothetical protein